MNKKKLGILILILMMFIPSIAFSASNTIGTRGISIEKNKTYQENIILDGISGINNKGSINGNVITYSSSINNNGIIKGNVISLASTFDSSGYISKNIIGLYKDIKLNNTSVKKDIIAFGENFNSNEKTVIQGDVNLVYKNAIIKGRVNGDTFIIGDKVTINGTIKGDVQVACNELVIGKNAKIKGNLYYSCDEPPIITDKNVVKGEYKAKSIGIDTSIFTSSSSSESSASHGFSFYYGCLSKISILILTLLLFHFFPITSLKMELFTRRNMWKCFKMGLLVSIILVPTIIILALTIVGFPFAIHLLSIYFDVTYFALIPSIIVIGGFLMPRQKIPYKALCGTFIMLLVDYLQFGIITHALIIIANLIGLGSIFMLIKLYIEYKIKREKTEYITLNSFKQSKEDLIQAKRKFERIKKERFDQAMRDRVKSEEELDDMIERIKDEYESDDESTDDKKEDERDE